MNMVLQRKMLRGLLHLQLGKELLEHSFKIARSKGCSLMNIGIVEENTRLRKWYEDNGAVHVGTKKFDFFQFTCGYVNYPSPKGNGLATPL